MVTKAAVAPAETVEVKYVAEPTLLKFHLSDAMYRVVRGPRAGGKSVGCSAELMMRAGRQKHGPDGIRHTRWAIIRNTYKQLEDSTLRTWMEWYGSPEEFNQRSMTHTMKRGDLEAQFVFRALDRPEDVANLLSVEYTGAWINETREVVKTVVDVLPDSVGRFPRKAAGGCTWRGIIMDTNPPDVDHWLYRLAEEEKPAGNLPDWEFFVQPGALMEVDGEFVPNPLAENIDNLDEGYDYYLKRCQGKSADHIRVYYCNQYGFVPAGRRVHEEYVDARHCAPEAFPPIEGLPIYFGCDWGLTPAVAFFQRTDRGQIRVFDEIATEDIGVQNFGDLLLVPKLQGEFAAWKDVGIEGWGDPGVGRDNSEQTAFSILRAMGVPIKPASTNNPTLRREALALPLRRMIDGEPGLIISPKCVQLRKGLASKYVYRRVQMVGDERFHDKPDKNFWSHICFAGGTPISTPEGRIPIESLKAGDLVNTPYGARPISHVGQREAEVARYAFSDGGHVVCTPDHPLWIFSCFSPMEAVEYGQPVAKEERTWKILFRLHRCVVGRSGQYTSLEGSDIIGNRLGDIMSRIIGRAVSTFIGKFGPPISVRSQKVMRCITRMATAPITRWPILEFCQSPTIIQATCGSQAESNNPRRIWPWQSPQPLNGESAIQQRQTRLPGKGWQDSGELSGPQLKRRIPVHTAGRLTSATRTTRRWAGRDSAQVSVYQRTDGGARWITSIGSALYVGVAFALTSILRRRLVRLTAKEDFSRNRRETVHNIAVAGAHCYYAGGYLVSNCEALEYGMLGIGEGRVLTSSPRKKYVPRPRVATGPNAWLGM